MLNGLFKIILSDVMFSVQLFILFFWPLPLITKEQIAQGKINFIQSCIVLMKTGSNTKINKLGMCMGHQIKPVNIPFVFL